MEIESAGWQSNSSVGDTPADRRDEHANPLWGAPRIHGELLNAAHDRNRSAIVQKISLTRSLIPQQHRPILDQLLVRLSLRQGQAP
jgi:hypothetical protein